ncbi:YlbE-like family protein [Virgibacillus siamensis]|uniref:YlbE-like family protein n=1 Tax=Virgibacillus siamensis TaxID=480071 RepID=UPI000985CFAB|nr:YlbE-like family protein [Virgibacillus siamensis]
MQRNTYKALYENPSYINFVRQNPIWYRYLTREPDCIREIEREAKVYYGKTLPQRVEKFGNHLQMIHLFAQLAGSIKD